MKRAAPITWVHTFNVSLVLRPILHMYEKMEFVPFNGFPNS